MEFLPGMREVINPRRISHYDRALSRVVMAVFTQRRHLRDVAWCSGPDVAARLAARLNADLARQRGE